MTTQLTTTSGGGALVRCKTPRANTLYNRIQEFLATDFVGCAPGTLKNHRQSLELFEIYAGNHPLDPQLINAFAGWIENVRQLNPQTTRDHIRRLKRFLRWCYRLDYLPRDFSYFCARVMVPAPPTPLTFSYQEYETLRDAAEGSSYEWAFILAYHTGLDLVDVCFFRWRYVDLAELIINCQRIKMSRCASSVCHLPIIVGSDLHTALVRMTAERPANPPPQDEDFVCPELAKAYSWADTNIHQSFLRFIHRYCPRKSFRTFRRTFASNCANSGMNVALACRMTAHSDPQTFLRYVRPDSQAIREGMENALRYAREPKNKTAAHPAPPPGRRGPLPQNEPAQTQTQNQTGPLPET